MALITIPKETKDPAGKTRIRRTIYITLDAWKLLNQESEKSIDENGKRKKSISKVVEELVIRRYGKAKKKTKRETIKVGEREF